MNDFKYSIVEERKASFADAKFYKEVAKKAKDFGIMGKNSIMNGIYVNEAQGSHFWFACLSDQIAREQGSRLITLEDAGLILKKENFIKGFYCEFNQLNLFSNKAIFEKNQPLIDYLSGELKNLGYEFSPENPISIKGAKILEDKNKKNKYGLKLDLENAIIENDLRFVSGTKIIDLNGTEKKLRTKTAGLSRLFLIVNDLDSGYDILSYSGRCGRVVVSKQVF